MECIAIATSILKLHEVINSKKFAYCFTVSHYLISTTMVMIGLVSKDVTLKSKFSGVILQSVQSLNIYCHSNWVSGKMMRWVSKLLDLANKFASSYPTKTIKPSAYAFATQWPQPDVLVEKPPIEKQLDIDLDPNDPPETGDNTSEELLLMISDAEVGSTEEHDEDNLFQLPGEHWQSMMAFSDYIEASSMQTSWPLIDFTWSQTSEDF